jgi:putative transposase
MNEYEKRKQAIQRHLAGENVTSIVNSLGKSRPWFYNWFKRYQAAGGEGNWFEDQSRAPKTTPTKVSETLEQQVLAVRKELEAKGIAQTGAIAISYELRNRGFDPPEVWTINRILARHQVARNKPVRRSNKEYPELFFHTHQMDLVGPRYIKGDGRFYSVNIIDSLSRCCSVNPVRTKASLSIAQALAGFWSTHGMPDALQMDNELAFRGSNRYPRSFGTIVRFALAMGVAPVFIPVAEPWRNGIIERFNSTYDKRFYRSQSFTNFEHVKQASSEFSNFHNHHHRYSTLDHKTPNQMQNLLQEPVLYDGRINIEQRIPLLEGEIYFIRFIRSDSKLHLPNESFPVDPSLKYSYVVAQISVENHCLHIMQNKNIIQTIEYTMPVDW